MISVRFGALMLGVCCLFVSATPEPGPVDTASLKHIANVSYAENSNLSNVASIFSPRMDFDQWKPLTGRGDPLRNDPTYDYEPPVLERVHYWADDTRLEREHYPERKSEVLMLGVSSRKPSVSPRHPSSPRRPHRPTPYKYEDYSYKISDHYPMTILVPPPPPLPGHKPPLYILNDKPVMPNPQIKITSPPKIMKDATSTTIPEKLTSLYALQESNLIYQSSTASQSSVFDSNQTQSLPNRAVSSDYAGWGPTTPFDEIEADNDKHNLIFSDHLDLPKQPYSFYKPMLSEAPPPPRVTQNPLLLPTFVPTALPPAPVRYPTTVSTTQPTWPTQPTTTETTNMFDYNEETTTDTYTAFPTTPVGTSRPQSSQIILDMMTSMMSMPMANGPERPEDHLYAHASENQHIYKEHSTEDTLKLETMQTMQPPPPVAAGNKITETTTLSHKPSSLSHTTILHEKPMSHLDPYLHMRFTTPMPIVESSEIMKVTSEAPTVPMYLIIQGHSKVKTYGSKPTPIDENDTINNEIPKQTDNNEVKHLHPLKERYSSQKTEKGTIRRSKAQNLRSLVDEGRGSIELQETDVGIKYDVSDGSEVPVEIYRKGFVDNDENDYAKSKKFTKEKRTKRQLDIDDVLPFDEDKLEKYVYNFLKGRRNETGITGVIAQAITGSTGELLDDIEEDEDDDDEDDDEQR